MARPTYETLMTCPLNQPMRVSRVSDQDREFLEFIERHDLKPGAVVEVAERDAAADSVRVKGAREFTIGARAASKVLVRAAGIVLLLLSLCPAAAGAATAAASEPATEPFRITDNSFLVEEAFNQEAGIFQNIFNAARADEAWASTFTQEWPVCLTDPPVLVHPRLGKRRRGRRSATCSSTIGIRRCSKARVGRPSRRD